MDAVILAGGRSSRLYPLTLNRPKVLMPLLDRTLIDHLLEKVREAGIRQVTVVADRASQEALRTVVMRHVGRLRATVVVQPEPLGIADAMLWARPNVGSEHFVLILADNLFTAPLSALWEDFDPHQVAGRLWVTQVDDPSRFGIVETDAEQNIVRLVEKPKTTPSNLAICGIYLLPQRIFELAEENRPAEGEFEITPLLQLLHEERGLDYRLLPGDWEDAGTLLGFLRAQWLLLKRLPEENQQYVHQSARIEHSTLMGPVWIGPHCEVVESRVGPNVALIGNVALRGIRASNCTFMNGVRLIGEPPGAEIERSILGVGARLTLHPGRYEDLMLADYSELTAMPI